jgi:IS5 family transposase
MSLVSEIEALLATAFGRSAASRRYDQRTGYVTRSLKTTLLVDIKPLAILNVHYSTGKPHDTQIGWPVVK